MLVVSDECYLEFGYEAEPVSVLHPDVCGGDHTGLLALHSLSKRSNLAGYRFGFAAGDPAVVAELVAIRKHLGLMVPEPGPGGGGRGARRRRATSTSSEPATWPGARCCGPRSPAAGWRVEHSEAGLYLWLTRDDGDCWAQVGAPRRPGHPGRPRAPSTAPPGASTSGPPSPGTDERIGAAAQRLRSP